MGIQNSRAIDKDGNTIELPFKDWIEHPDTCVGFTIELCIRCKIVPETIV